MSSFFVEDNQELTQILIEKIKKHSFIYDFDHEDYKNLRKKNNTWEEIGSECGIDGEQAKKKWKNLRDTFSKYVKSTVCTDPNAKKYYGSWQWAKQMQFLYPFLVKPKRGALRKHAGTMNISEDEVIIKTEQINNEYEDSIGSDASEHQETQSAPCVGTWPLSVALSQQGNQFKEKNNDTETKQYAPREWAQKRLAPDLEELELLFLGHAKSVKKLCPRRQTIVKMKLAQLIAEEELSQLDGETETN